MSKSHKCIWAVTDIQTAAYTSSNKTAIKQGNVWLKFTQSRLYTMKLKYNWLILLRYSLNPSLNPFKAHIVLQMSSYENVKAIK